MMRKLWLSLAACMPMLTAFSQNGLWSTVSKNAAQTYLNGRSAVSSLPAGYELVKLNRNLLQQLQQRAPLVKTGQRSSISPVQISFPLPVAGQFLSGAFTESPVLTDELAKQLPNFKTYEIKDPLTKRLQGRVSITPQGVTGLIFTDKGAMYIQPVNAGYPDVHMAYYVKDLPVTEPLQCGVKEMEAGTVTGARMQSILAGDCQLRNYRLAVAATGEYTTWAGDQWFATMYIATLINDVRTIYERELGITFTLITNNSLLYTNAATDPYATVSFPTGALLTTNHNTITSVLGTGGFDIGFLLNRGWNGGLAAGSSACVPAWKGMGGAGMTFGTGINPTPGPQGPIFVSTVAHEIAHQFSAMHTMAATNGACGGSNSVPSSAYEPGAGSTIMAYAGSCSTNYYQFYSDMYFHNGSIMQIMDYAVNSATCAVTTPMSNTAPSVSVPAASYTIPASTPFVLTATGADATNNTIYYSWEQMDAGLTGTFAPSDLNTMGANFRSYPATTNNTRFFPKLADVVAGVSPTYEVLPSVSRSMNFMVMVHDYSNGGGCTAQQSVAVNTDASGGPFSVTSQTTATNWVANGSNTATITWNVGVTNAAPINVSNVDIIFSSDGGVTFTDTLAANTANDGSETIVIPSLATGVGRIMIKPRNNIFYNVNAANISITSTCAANGSNITPSLAVTGTVGNNSLNLTLSPLYGTPVSIGGTLAATDPTGQVVVENITYNHCENFGSGNQYDAYRFTPSVSGNYTFTRTTGDQYCVVNLYSGNYTPGDGCSNYITSTGRFDEDLFDLSFVDNFTVSLSAGQ
ncbi:MAG TPA: M12 family metallo-peptidase, partial [Niastella sp.]